MERAKAVAMKKWADVRRRHIETAGADAVAAHVSDVHARSQIDRAHGDAAVHSEQQMSGDDACHLDGAQATQ